MKQTKEDNNQGSSDLSYAAIKKNEVINTYIRQADLALSTLGFTEHSFAHVTLVAEKAGYILSTLGYDERMIELVKIAGYLHDIGNLINRVFPSFGKVDCI